MLLDNEVKIKIGTKNLKYFRNLNYECNIGDIINIDTTHLMNTSKVLVKVKCDVCGNVTKIEWRSYVKNISKYPVYCCNTSCAKIKENQTKLEKYGEDYEKNRVIKMKKTNKKRYGDENTSQIFRNEKNQFDFINELNEIYRDEDFDYSKIDYVNNYTKVIVVCKKHGSFEIRPRELLIGQGCKKCNREKIRQETLKVYIYKSNVIHNNKYDYADVKFIGVDKKIDIICPIHGKFKQSFHNHLSGKGCIKCANIKKRIDKIKEIEQNIKDGNQITPVYNKNACKLFDKISEEKNIHIQHAMNGGEYYIKELGYWLDGYDKDNNVVYEYDEKRHFSNGKLKEKDVIRQEEITNFLRCEFIRIKEGSTENKL